MLFFIRFARQILVSVHYTFQANLTAAKMIAPVYFILGGNKPGLCFTTMIFETYKLCLN